MKNAKQHDDPVVYSARGKVCGIYRPSAENFLRGMLVTEDGLEIPAEIARDVLIKLRANRELLKVSQVWKCYPRTNPPRVELVKLKSEAKAAQELKRKGVDRFRVVGRVEGVSGEGIRVLVKRNEPLSRGEERAFALTLRGSLPPDAVGQFWQFNARREGWDLQVTAATLRADAVPMQRKEKKRSLSVSVTEAEYRAVEVYAKQCGKSRAEVLRELIRELPTFGADS
jgi:hypothetical protein